MSTFNANELYGEARYLRNRAEGAPHTEELLIMIEADGNHMEAFSGHMPITLQTFSSVVSSPAIEPSERVEMWHAVVDQIGEMVAAEGFTYVEPYFVRDFNVATSSGKLLAQYEDAANAAMDRIWRFKNLLQMIGVRKFLELCRTLNDGDAEAVEAIKQYYDPQRIYFPTQEILTEIYAPSTPESITIY